VSRWSALAPWLAATLGAAAALVWHAPARWLADAVATQTKQHVLLADSQGSLWSGSAQLVLTAGKGSRDASRLPGRVHWAWAWQRGGAELQLRMDCCTTETVGLRVTPGWRQWSLALAPSAQPLLRLPAAWLAGLGTPFNTLQPSGDLWLRSPEGLKAEKRSGHWTLQGGVQLEMRQLGTRLASVNPLGHYQLDLRASGQLQLQTLAGSALHLQGNGQLLPRLQWQGEASATPGFELALDNLLNIVGRRQGARSMITIG
jgi:general secretion pathway protein N